MAARLREKLNHFDSTLPLGQARTIPSLFYFDDEIYAAECCCVFGSTCGCSLAKQ